MNDILEAWKALAHRINTNFKISNIWNDFEENIKFNNRFFVDKEFKKLLNTFLLATEDISKGTRFFRARLVAPQDYDDLKTVREKNRIFGLPESKMKSPPKGTASPGRANPAGISYLYLASNPQTACAEVRSMPIDLISVTPFINKRDLKVVNLFKVDTKDMTDEEVLFFEKVRIAFMLPVRERCDLEYSPTQYIASYIKERGFDGIKYLTFSDENPESYNLVLFDESTVEVPEANKESAYIYRMVSKNISFQNLSISSEVSAVKKGKGKLSDQDIAEMVRNLEPHMIKKPLSDDGTHL